VLGFDEASTPTKTEISRAYWKLAKEWHPDKNMGSAESHAKMQEINEARDTLVKHLEIAQQDEDQEDSEEEEEDFMDFEELWREMQKVRKERDAAMKKEAQAFKKAQRAAERKKLRQNLPTFQATHAATLECRTCGLELTLDDFSAKQIKSSMRRCKVCLGGEKEAERAARRHSSSSSSRGGGGGGGDLGAGSEFEASDAPLAVAIRVGLPMIVTSILGNDAAAIYADLGKGSTALHFAARFGDEVTAQKLINIAGDQWATLVLAVNEDGLTPLGCCPEFSLLFADWEPQAKVFRGTVADKEEDARYRCGVCYALSVVYCISWYYGGMGEGMWLSTLALVLGIGWSYLAAHLGQESRLPYVLGRSRDWATFSVPGPVLVLQLAVYWGWLDFGWYHMVFWFLVVAKVSLFSRGAVFRAEEQAAQQCDLWLECVLNVALMSVAVCVLPYGSTFVSSPSASVSSTFTGVTTFFSPPPPVPNWIGVTPIPSSASFSAGLTWNKVPPKGPAAKVAEQKAPLTMAAHKWSFTLTGRDPNSGYTNALLDPHTAPEEGRRAREMRVKTEKPPETKQAQGSSGSWYVYDWFSWVFFWAYDLVFLVLFAMSWMVNWRDGNYYRWWSQLPGGQHWLLQLFPACPEISWDTMVHDPTRTRHHTVTANAAFVCFYLFDWAVFGGFMLNIQLSLFYAYWECFLYSSISDQNLLSLGISVIIKLINLRFEAMPYIGSYVDLSQSAIANFIAFCLGFVSRKNMVHRFRENFNLHTFLHSIIKECKKTCFLPAVIHLCEDSAMEYIKWSSLRASKESLRRFQHNQNLQQAEQAAASREKAARQAAERAAGRQERQEASRQLEDERVQQEIRASQADVLSEVHNALREETERAFAADDMAGLSSAIDRFKRKHSLKAGDKGIKAAKRLLNQLREQEEKRQKAKRDLEMAKRTEASREKAAKEKERSRQAAFAKGEADRREAAEVRQREEAIEEARRAREKKKERERQERREERKREEAAAAAEKAREATRRADATRAEARRADHEQEAERARRANAAAELAGRLLVPPMAASRGGSLNPDAASFRGSLPPAAGWDCPSSSPPRGANKSPSPPPSTSKPMPTAAAAVARTSSAAVAAEEEKHAAGLDFDSIWEAQQVIAEADDDFSCVVCMEREETMIIVPCGHQCLCDECAPLFPRGASCPYCRGKVEAVIRVHKR